MVHVHAVIIGSSAELAARLWDVGPSSQSIISRTNYRLEEGTSGTTTVDLAFELWPTAWQLVCGHHLRLELTQDDAPSWRADNLSSSMTLSNLTVGLPEVPGSAC